MSFLLLMLGLLPGFVWLLFYLAEDPHPEPKRLIAFTFFAGIAVAFITVAVELLFNSAMTDIGIVTLSILSLLGLACIEELMKFAAAYFSISHTPEIKDPVDPMVYMIIAALGFATLENIGTLASISTSTPLLAAAFETISLRFVGATLLHTLTSGIVGYHWSLGITKKKVGEYLAAGIIFATLCHAAFNYLILNFANVGYSVLFLIVVGFFVMTDFEELKAEEPVVVAQ